MADSTAGPRPTRSDYRVFSPVPTRWGDADALGHINNVMFMRYIESGRLDYFQRLCGITLEPDSRQGFVLASLTADFLAQVHHPALLETGTRVTRLGNRSFDIESSIFAEGEENPVFTSLGICVWYDFENACSMVIPDDVRNRVNQFESGTEK